MENPTETPVVPKTEWVGREMDDSSIVSFSAWNNSVPSKARYRAVKITKDDREAVFSLGDIVHLESGAEDGVPYVARIAALYEDTQNHTKHFQAQWLYRPWDLGKNCPPDFVPTEMFITAHSDPNRVEVIIEGVRCKVVDASGRVTSTRLSSDDPTTDDSALETRYILKRAFDHTTMMVEPLSGIQAQALKVYSDDTAAFAAEIHIPKKKKSPPSAESKKSEVSVASKFKAESKNAAKDKPLVASTNDSVAPSSSQDTGGDAESRRASKRSRGAMEISGGNVENSDSQAASRHQEPEDIYQAFRASGMHRLLQHMVEEFPCRGVDCLGCTQFMDTLRPHCLRCEDEACPIPQCNSLRSILRLEHAVDCESCGRPSCVQWKQILDHLGSKDASSCDRSTCETCRLIDETLEKHDELCGGECKHPRCAVTTAILSHGGKTGGGEHCPSQEGDSRCIECALFARLCETHRKHCSTGKGRCRFPLCEGYSNPSSSSSSVLRPSRQQSAPVSIPPPKTTTASTTTTVPSVIVDKPQPTASSAMVTRHGAAAFASPSKMMRRGAAIEHHAVPIGPQYQAKIEPLVPAFSMTTRHEQSRRPPPSQDLPLWTLKGSAEAERNLRDTMRRLVLNDRFYVGKVVAVLIPDNGIAPFTGVSTAASLLSTRSCMLARVARYPKPYSPDQTLWVVPYDAVWPAKPDDPGSIVHEGVASSAGGGTTFSHPLMCKVKREDLVVTDTLLEHAMLLVQHELNPRFGTTNFGKRLREMIESDQAWRMSDVSFVESWSEHEFRIFCKAVRERKAELSLDTIVKQLGGSKTLPEVARMFYFHAHGVARAPPGLVLCVKCLNADATHACKQFFSCRTALCAACFKSSRPRGQQAEDLDESDASFYFCSACSESDRRVSSQVVVDGIKLVEPFDGYDDSIAWNCRSTSVKAQTLVDAVAALDDIMYLFPPSTYRSVVSSLISFEGGQFTRDQLLAQFEETNKNVEGSGKSVLAALHPFIS